MKIVRRLFYALIGFTWPIFFVLHASGFWAVLYRPFFNPERPSLWPPFLTSLLLYALLILLFELWSKARGDLEER